MDKLDKLFEEQKQLQKFFGHILGQISNGERKSYLYDNILDSIEELSSIRKLNNKKEWDVVKDASKQNVCDLLHFIINICMVLEITPEELFETYNKRNQHIYKNAEKYKSDKHIRR